MDVKTPQKHVVVVGGSYAGLNTARALDKKGLRVRARRHPARAAEPATSAAAAAASRFAAAHAPRPSFPPPPSTGR